MLVAKVGYLPSAEEVKQLLHSEKVLRLDPLMQVVYAMPGQLSTELTNQIQLRVVREAGLPDEAVQLIRSAQYLYPDEPEMSEIPHCMSSSNLPLLVIDRPYFVDGLLVAADVKFNRSKPGQLTVGSKAPSCSVVELDGTPTSLGCYFQRSQTRGRPLVLIGGSFT